MPRKALCLLRSHSVQSEGRGRGKKEGMEEVNNLSVASLLWKNKAKSGKGGQLLFRGFSHSAKWTLDPEMFFWLVKRSLLILDLFPHVSKVSKGHSALYGCTQPVSVIVKSPLWLWSFEKPEKSLTLLNLSRSLYKKLEDWSQKKSFWQGKRRHCIITLWEGYCVLMTG